MRTDGRTGGQRDGQIHDEAKRRFFGTVRKCIQMGSFRAQKYRKHMLFVIFITVDLSMMS